MELSPEEMKFVLQGGEIKVSRQGDKVITACSISSQTVSLRSSVPDNPAVCILALAAAIRAVYEKRLSAAKEDLKNKARKSSVDGLLGGLDLNDIFGFK